MHKRLFIFLLMFFIPPFALAEGTIITLEKALSIATKNNLSLKREAITLNTTKRISEHSWNPLLPSVTISANDEIELPDLKRGNVDDSIYNGFRNNVGIEGKIALSLSSGYFASREKAKLDYETSRLSYEETVSEIHFQVKEKYFSLLLEKQNLDFLKENLENAKSQANQNEVRFKKGTLSEMECLSSKATYEKLKTEFKTQELLYKNNRLLFLRFLGVKTSSENDNEEAFSLSGTLEEYVDKYASFFDEEKKVNLAQNINAGDAPSIASLKKQLEAALKQVSVEEHNAYGPSLNLAYAINPVITGAERGRIKQSASIGISLPLENLLSFSKGADEIANAQDKVNEIELSIKEKTQDANDDFLNITENLAEKEKSVMTFKSLVDLSQKNYDAVYYAYSKGMTEHLSLKTAAKEKLEAKLNLQNEFLEMLKLYITLEKLSGKSLPLEA